MAKRSLFYGLHALHGVGVVIEATSHILSHQDPKNERHKTMRIVGSAVGAVTSTAEFIATFQRDKTSSNYSLHLTMASVKLAIAWIKCVVAAIENCMDEKKQSSKEMAEALQKFHIILTVLHGAIGVGHVVAEIAESQYDQLDEPVYHKPLSMGR